MRGTLVALTLPLVGACHAMAPPPFVPMHADTAPKPEDTTTAMLVVGVAGEPLGGSGIGAAVRVERQATAGTTLGLELTGGRGETEPDPTGIFSSRYGMFGLRGYGRTSSTAHDWVAVTYGAGLSVFTNGQVDVAAHGGGAVSYPNDYVVPSFQLSLALAVPLTDGAPFTSSAGTPEPRVWIVGDMGLLGHIPHTENDVSVDLGLGGSNGGDMLMSLSAADGQRFEPDACIEEPTCVDGDSE